MLKIFCCGCNSDVDARLTNGFEIYPHRSDLSELPFWICDFCGNYVGCHHKTKDKTRPLGVIPTKELKRARQSIHQILDPIWKGKFMKRKAVYSYLSENLGYKYHTANIKSLNEARRVYEVILQLRGQFTNETQ